MKKVFCFLLVLIGAFGLMASPSLAATTEEYINQADIDLLATVDNALTEFAKATEVGGSDEQLLTTIDGVIEALRGFATHEFSQEVNQDYSSQTIVIKQKAANLQKKLELLRQTYSSNHDDSQISAVAEQTGAALEDYVNAVEKLNGVIDAIGQTPDDFATFYLVLLLAMAVLAFGSFVWSFRWPEVMPERLKARHRVACFSLIPLVGAAITYFSYRFAPADGEYMIAWGAVIFGLINYIKVIIDYRKLLQSAD